MIRTLSAAYFVGEISIPNISGTTIIDQANLKNLQISIAIYEPLFLKDLLGEDLYTAYAAGIAEVTPDAKWTTLNNKIYYTDAALTALSTGISPVANYIYFQFHRNNASVTLQNSEVKPGHQNFTVTSPAQKMVSAWNNMVRLCDEIQEFIEDNITDYPEFETSDVPPRTFEKITMHGC